MIEKEEAMTGRDDSLKETPKPEPWQERAKLLRLIAHPVRLAILEMLCEGPRCVKHINSLVTIPQPHLSQHIAALRKSHLITYHACGPVRCYYLLQPTLIENLIGLLRQEHLLQEQDCNEVISQARQGWEERMEQECPHHAIDESVTELFLPKEKS